MTSQSAPFPGPGDEVSGKQNGFIAGNDNNNSSASCILDPSSRIAISIALPDAEAFIQWKCKASTSFGEVIKQVCAEHGLDAALHVLVIDNDDDDVVHVEGSECRPGNLVGLSKRRQFLLLPRAHLVKDPYSYKNMREKKASVTTVEMTNRVLVLLPQQKRVVIRTSLKETVKSVFDRVCSEKQLYPPDYVVYHPETREPLDMNKSLADYNIMEMLIEKISGPCESQTLPRRTGGGTRGMLPSRMKAKSASKATGSVFNEDLSNSRGTYHGSSVSLAVDGVHGERRGKKPSKINAFLTFLKIKKKKKPRKEGNFSRDGVDGSIENLSASPISSPIRDRPTLLSGGRPVSAFIPPESLPAQRQMKKRRAPAPPSKSGQLSGEEVGGRLKAQAAVPGLSQSVPALPSVVPVQVDIEVDEPRQPAPEDDKPRRRRAAPRPPTPPQDVEDDRRAPPTFVAPPPPVEPPPADIPVTLKPYHEDKAVDTANVSELTMDVTGNTANVQIAKRPEHKLSINDNRKKNRIRDGLSLQAAVNAGNRNQPQVNVGKVSSGPVLHVDKPSIQPDVGVVVPEVNVAPSLAAEGDGDVSYSLPQVVDNVAVKLDADEDKSFSNIQLKGRTPSMEPEFNFAKAAHTHTDMKLNGDSLLEHDMDYSKSPSPQMEMKLNGDSLLEPELDVTYSPSTQVELELNSDSLLEPELYVTDSPSPHVEMEWNGGSSLKPHLSKDESLLPRLKDDISKFPDEYLGDCSYGEGIEADSGNDIDLKVKRKIRVGDLNFGVGDEESSSSESEDRVTENEASEDEGSNVDRKVAVILMSSESRVFEDFDGSNFEEKCAAESVTGDEDDELRERICQETAASLVSSVIASAVIEYKTWNAYLEDVVETSSEEGDKPERESKFKDIKTYVVQDEDRKRRKDISASSDEEDREKRASNFLEDHHFDIEMEKILSEDQDVGTDFKERTSDEYSEDEVHHELKAKLAFCAPHQEDREEVFFTPGDDANPQMLQFTASQGAKDVSLHSDTQSDSSIPLDNLHKGDSPTDLDIGVSLGATNPALPALVMDGDRENHDVEGFAAVDVTFKANHDVEGFAAVDVTLKANHDVEGFAAVDEDLKAEFEMEPEDQVFDISTAADVQKTQSARSRCHELAFDPEAAEEDEQMEVKLVTPVCSPVKLQVARRSSPVSSGTLHTDNDLPLSDSSSLAQRSTSPVWSAGSGGPRSIFLKAMEQQGPNPVLESLEQQVEHWKDQLDLNRKRLEDSDSGGSYAQENLMQEQIKLQQALVAQMEKNISSLRARSSSSEVTSSSSICPSSKSVASDQPSSVAPAHVAPKITRQRDQHRDAAKPIFDSTVHLPQASARAARMAARAERRSESVKSDEM